MDTAVPLWVILIGVIICLVVLRLATLRFRGDYDFGTGLIGCLTILVGIIAVLLVLLTKGCGA